MALAARPLATRESVALPELSETAWIATTGIYRENFIALCTGHGPVRPAPWARA
ncbi:hypothetical protein ACWEPC_23165 [Nonomuraea sp. NPDC004297]